MTAARLSICKEFPASSVLVNLRSDWIAVDSKAACIMRLQFLGQTWPMSEKSTYNNSRTPGRGEMCEILLRLLLEGPSCKSNTHRFHLVILLPRHSSMLPITTLSNLASRVRMRPGSTGLNIGSSSCMQTANIISVLMALCADMVRICVPVHSHIPLSGNLGGRKVASYGYPKSQRTSLVDRHAAVSLPISAVQSLVLAKLPPF